MPWLHRLLPTLSRGISRDWRHHFAPGACSSREWGRVDSKLPLFLQDSWKSLQSEAGKSALGLLGTIIVIASYLVIFIFVPWVR